MTDINSVTVKVTQVAGAFLTVAGILWGAMTWAEGKHEELSKEAKEQKEVVNELKTSNELLKRLVIDQAKTLEKAADNAQANREALIRIEAKVENP